MIRFGIDLDGVICDFGDSVIKVANSIWPGKLPLDYVPQNWNYADVFSKEDWESVWAEIKATPNFWITEKPIEANLEALKDFIYSTNKGLASDIYFITSRVRTCGDSVLYQSSEWLDYHEVLVPNHHAVIPVEDAKHKEAVCRALKLPFMLDDYAPTVQKLQNIEGLQAYVLDQPWNRWAEELPRVYSVAEYLEIVKAG